MTGRENLAMVARLYGQSAALGPRRQRRHAGAARPGRRRRPPGEDLLGRDAPAPRPRGQPGGSPRLLLLDEPTTGLDPRSRIELWDAIRALGDSGHRRPAHHPVPRRGRPPRRAHRHHRRRDGWWPRDRRPSSSSGWARTCSTCTPARRRPWPRRRGARARWASGRPSIDVETQRCSIDAPKGSGVLALVVRALDDAGIDIEDVTVRHPTLDEVFLKLTGDRAVESRSERRSDPHRSDTDRRRTTDVA